MTLCQHKSRGVAIVNNDALTALKILGPSERILRPRFDAGLARNAARYFLLFDFLHPLKENPMLCIDYRYSLYVSQFRRRSRLPALPSSLTHLTLSSCHDLRELSDLPSTLTHLEIIDCPRIEFLPPLPVTLKSLCLNYCGLKDFPQLPESLTFLSVVQCHSLTKILALPVTLNTLLIDESPKLKTLPDFPQNLEAIHLSWLDELSSIPKLPESTKYFAIRFCPLITFLPILPKGLEYLVAQGNCCLETPELPIGLVGILVNFNADMTMIDEGDNGYFGDESCVVKAEWKYFERIGILERRFPDEASSMKCDDFYDLKCPCLQRIPMAKCRRTFNWKGVASRLRQPHPRAQVSDPRWSAKTAG